VPNLVPNWLATRRDEARVVYESTPLPTLRDERWRYTSLRGIDFDAYRAVAEAPAAGHAPTLLGELESSGHLHQVGDSIVELRAPDGIAFGSLEEAADRGADVVVRYLGSLVGATDRFTAENAARFAGGALIHVPEGVSLPLPLHLTFAIPEEGARTTFRVLVVAEARSRVTIVEEHAGGAAGYLNGVVEIVVGDGAEVDYIRTQDLHRSTVHFTTARAEVGRDAALRWTAIDLGGRIGKARMESRLSGPGASVKVTGLYALDGDQHLDLDTTQEHAAPNATSDLAFKGVLQGHSRSVWRGIIRVDKGAQKTDAFQENRNMLLSPHAHADSIPGLEILANDVRCTHAATIGQVDRELLFFLMSRGFSRTEATRLIVQGFFADALERVADETVRERLDSALTARVTGA
jgi:Fe-S cluster assembly protein SufD